VAAGTLLRHFGRVESAAVSVANDRRLTCSVVGCCPLSFLLREKMRKLDGGKKVAMPGQTASASPVVPWPIRAEAAQQERDAAL
jgi:hypothetical protein